MATQLKRIRKSGIYKYVSLFKDSNGLNLWGVQMFGNSKYYDTEREAALAVDIKLIEKGKNPVNILKKK